MEGRRRGRRHRLVRTGNSCVAGGLVLKLACKVSLATCHHPTLVPLRLQLRQSMTSCPLHLPSPDPSKTSVLHGNSVEVNNLLTSGKAWLRPTMLFER